MGCQLQRDTNSDLTGATLSFCLILLVKLDLNIQMSLKLAH